MSPLLSFHTHTYTHARSHTHPAKGVLSLLRFSSLKMRRSRRGWLYQVVCSVAGGDDGVLMVVARKTVPTVFRDQTEKIEKIPYTFLLLLFLFFNFYFIFNFLGFFAMFYVDIGYFFLDTFFVFFMFIILGFPIYIERRKRGVFSS